MSGTATVNGRTGSDLERELRKVVEGDVRFDDYSRLLYASDASMYQVEPIGVVMPRSAADVHAVLELANRYNVPVLPRGGGTSLAGQTVNHAVVLDFSRYMNRVLEVDPKGKIAWSIDQKELPGVTLAWVTTLHVLPSGNVVIGNCHAGPANPQLVEVTRDKKVVWTFKDHKTFGDNLASAQILGVEGKVIR